MPTYNTAANYPIYAAGESIIELAYNLTAATGTTAGGVAAIANPFGVDLIIINSLVDIQTAATTATNTFDIGIAANGTTTSDTLYDGQVTSAGLKSTGGTNGALPRKWTTTQYVTGTASATLVGMVAVLHLVCVRA